MMKKLFIIACVLAVIGAAAGGALYYAYPVQVSTFAGLTRNYILSWSAPSGTTTTELNTAYKEASAAASSPVQALSASASAGGMTPTAGGVVFFGDIGGNFYALDAANGQKLWGRELGGAIGGGVITYTANGAQKVAVAAGFAHPVWPTKIVTAKVIVLGLDGTSASK